MFFAGRYGPYMSDSVSQPVHYYKSPLGASLAPVLDAAMLRHCLDQEPRGDDCHYCRDPRPIVSRDGGSTIDRDDDAVGVGTRPRC